MEAVKDASGGGVQRRRGSSGDGGGQLGPLQHQRRKARVRHTRIEAGGAWETELTTKRQWWRRRPEIPWRRGVSAIDDGREVGERRGVMLTWSCEGKGRERHGTRRPAAF
jgi:hypothetical protein